MVFNHVGCPIRKCPDQWSFAPTRTLSQLTTSFFASQSQGIHRSLFLSFSFAFGKYRYQMPLGGINRDIASALRQNSGKFCREPCGSLQKADLNVKLLQSAMYG